MRPTPLESPGPFERVDERDVVFSRARLCPGTDTYRAYYARHPERQVADDRFRALPGLASPGGQRYQPGEAALVEAQFDASDLVAAAVEASAGRELARPGGLGPGGATAADLRPARPFDHSRAGLTRFVKEAARFLGADDVGIAALERGFVYSHRGRPTERFGEPVHLPHRAAIVMVFAMRHEYVLAGPEMVATAEVARVYQQASAACFGLSNALGRLGFPARAHVDSNYLVMCPPLAVQAGLGELGRNGVLIHPTHGPGVRLGVVTVDADLDFDRPRCLGVADFCRICSKCARTCPAKAISDGEPEIVRGARKWPTQPERCYHYWRTQGTDCGICLRTCPFAKPDTWLHRVVRAAIVKTTAWNRFFLWCDDLVYGRNAGPAAPPLLGIGRN